MRARGALRTFALLGLVGRAVLAPAAAETLAALDAADRVVAVGDWIVWPPELAALPRLGGYDAPNEEALAALGIDTLVTTASLAGRSGRERLTRLGIRVVELDTETLDGALGAIAELGRLAGREAHAARLLDGIETGLAAVAQRSAGAERRKVLVVVGREPLFVAGPGSHLDELLRIAGGANVAADLGSPYAQASLEAMLARRPEVIVDLSDNRRGARRGQAAGAWSAWPFLPAVAEGRVWFVDPIRLSIPGPRLVESAEMLASLIHPERFGTPDAATLGPLPVDGGPVR
jgi:ABC-type Fe3+-hydroxamate transport system substrate-binding protein